MASDAVPQKVRGLVGVWVGELVGLNVPYGVDYRRCVAFAIEGVTNTGKVISKWTAGDGAKNMQTGATYGVKPIAARWNGELTGNGNVLRFVGDNGSAILEFPLPSSNKMEGRATFKDGNGRVFLTKQ